jgi:hypothetical protein
MLIKRIIIILIVVAVGGYFINDYYQGKAKEKREFAAEKVACQEKREESHVAVAHMVSKYNAVNDWEDKLREGSTGKRENKENILTMELENLWLINRPILFRGTIKDISTFDTDNYLMTLDGRWKTGTQWALTLKSPKTMIDSFLNAHPKAASHGFTVAVIAKINKLDTNYRVTEEGSGEEKTITEGKTITGVGQCLDILNLFREYFYETWCSDVYGKE